METNPLTEKLRPHVADIEASAAKGNVRAKEVITLYGMYCRCPDPGSFGLCNAAFDEWHSSRAPSHGATVGA